MRKLQPSPQLFALIRIHEAQLSNNDTYMAKYWRFPPYSR